MRANALNVALHRSLKPLILQLQPQFRTTFMDLDLFISFSNLLRLHIEIL
jgi:hypothetical protein